MENKKILTHTGNGKQLIQVREDDKKVYFIDVETQEEVSYSLSTVKRYIKEIEIVDEEIKEEEEVIVEEKKEEFFPDVEFSRSELILLRKGNYIPKSFLSKERALELADHIKLMPAGYYRGNSDEIRRNPISLERDLEKFEKLIIQNPNLEISSWMNPVGFSRLDKDLLRELMLTGCVKATPSGIILEKGVITCLQQKES